MSAIPRKAEVIHAVYDSQGQSRPLAQNPHELDASDEVDLDPSIDLDAATEELASLKITSISTTNQRDTTDLVRPIPPRYLSSGSVSPG